MQLHQLIDSTLLQPTTTIADVQLLCADALTYNFAAVCIPPILVKTAVDALKGSTVKVVTVIGFPLGYSAVEAKIAEILLAIVDGVTELDVVINITALKNNDWQYLAHEISSIMPIVNKHNVVVKIIIETGLLTDAEIIKCCELYSIAGVHYLKTSTGYSTIGATVHAVTLMRNHLPQHILIKASGGIGTKVFAQQLIEAGASRIGTSKAVELIS